MANIRTRTLWSTNGRAPDSRDVWDDTGHGLKQGRVDVDGSLMVHTEGYKSIKYLRTDSQGNVSEYNSIMEALTVLNVAPTVETKPGSNIMTFFISDMESTYPGIFRIDVRKEWEDADPEPEGSSNITNVRLWTSEVNIGVALEWVDGSTASYTFDSGMIPFRIGDHYRKSTAARRKNGAKYVVEMVKNLDAAGLAELKKLLGITESPAA